MLLQKKKKNKSIFTDAGVAALAPIVNKATSAKFAPKYKKYFKIELGQPFRIVFYR